MTPRVTLGMGVPAGDHTPQAPTGGVMGAGGNGASAPNRLYFGDNLEMLQEVPDCSVDLIYLDPPFNSQAHYNVLFKSPKEDVESAQAQAFRDMWIWGQEAEWAYKEIMKLGGGTARFVDALRSALNESDMMAYLVMMAIRLHVLHQKLKPTGSLYLHCDPTASHYLKILLDGIFGPNGFLSEVIWKRTHSHGSAKRYGPVHDVVLYYAKSDKFFWGDPRLPHSEAYVKKHFTHVDEATGKKFQPITLTGSGVRRGASGLPWRRINPTDVGRHWALPGDILEELGIPNGSPQKRLDALDKAGRVYWPDLEGGTPRLKWFVDDLKGVAIQDIWTDIDPIPAQAAERIGYPTQKPITLLNRIIAASSKPGDVILDPFCGCGTTIEAAERAGRQWIGIDIAVHAIKVIEARLAQQIDKKIQYQVEGIPRDFPSAVTLAEKDKYQFQWWANYLFNPHAIREIKKGADRGIDGELFFPNGPGRPWGRMLTSVKGGANVGPNDVRAFARVLDREKAELGLFICLYSPTREMQKEADSVGFADIVHGDIFKLQIVAIEDWFKGKMPALPPLEHLPSAAFARRRQPAAQRRVDTEQPELPLTFAGGKADKNVVRHLNLDMVRLTA